MENKGFVYFLSNTEHPGIIKIGKSKNNPIIRADQLSRNTSAIGTFVHEWSKEVPSMDIAEAILHFIFREHHHNKEYFKINLETSKPLADKILDIFFKIDVLSQKAQINNQINSEEIDILKIEIEAEEIKSKLLDLKF